MKQLKPASLLVLATALTSNVNSQNSISGKVSDGKNAVAFAAITIKSSHINCVSSYDGNYTLSGLKPGTYILQTKCLGFIPKSDTVNITGNYAFDIKLTPTNQQLDEVVVNATRVDKNNGMAYSNIDSETLKKQNLGQDAPYMLNLLPSVVVNSDAGNGVGYTGLRIRGTDGTRVNVTINGVPVNDAESQGTFFVDMPDLVSSVNNIQVQRGVGTSGNGAGAFGATINFQTNQLNVKPYAQAISTAGSYDTYRNTLSAGTGLIENKFVLDARASNISSAGYIDRSSSKLQSYYLSAGYYGKKSVLKFINFLGQEKTGQAWNYVPEDLVKNGNRTYNSCGEYYDSEGNVRYYKNETDNYKQNNFQLHFIHQFNSRINLNVTGHYTKGAGYYEQYKAGAALANYGLPNVVTAKNDTITNTDLIRRLWLDNDFAGGIFNLNYTASSKLAFTLGGGYNTYFGKHFGRVMWARYASNSEIDYQYGLYTTNKNDGNIYLKANYRVLKKLHAFADLQWRKVDYRYYALAVNQKYQNQAYVFFNPKMGLSYDAGKHLNVYGSLSVANKEPSGDDLSKNLPALRPQSERLSDLELGTRYTRKHLFIGLGLYNMQYKNQLVLNGQIDNVGNPRHVNVAKSYRRGVELEVNAEVNKFLSLGANLTLSQNKILNFREYIDDNHINTYKNSDISFSPRVVSAVMAVLKPIKNFEITLTNKYVGKQYLDNTGNNKRSIAAYNVVDLRFNYSIKTKIVPELSFMFSLNNLLAEKYVTNGYTYSYYDNNALVTQNFLAPAALRNFMGGVVLKF